MHSNAPGKSGQQWSLDRLTGRCALCCYIQLFRERLSEKVHATIPKGIVGGFEFTVLQRNLREWQERPWTMFASAKGK